MMNHYLRAIAPLQSLEEIRRINTSLLHEWKRTLKTEGCSFNKAGTVVITSATACFNVRELAENYTLLCCFDRCLSHYAVAGQFTGGCPEELTYMPYTVRKQCGIILSLVLHKFKADGTPSADHH